jgi:hypothetical protein
MTISIAQILAQEPQGPCPPLLGILRQVRGLLSSYIAFQNKEQAVAVTLWIAHTWVFDAFDYTPYLFITSPVKRCGKSRVFDLLQLLCNKSFMVISPTEAVLFRKIEKDTPSLLVDEVDAIFKQNGLDENKEGLRAILNAGFYRGAVVPRCVAPQFELTDFHVYCPKALAGINKCLPDTVADRSITIVMARQIPGQSRRFRAREALPIAQPIAAALQNWARIDTRLQLQDARPDIPGGLGDRAADICEPLLAIADMAGEEWPDAARSSLVKLCKESEAEDDSNSIQLLRAIREIFIQIKVDRISTEKLLDELIKRDNGEPWGAWWSRDIAGGNYRGPSGRLAKLLKPFSIVPKTHRMADGIPARGYKLEEFEDVFCRYVPL